MDVEEFEVVEDDLDLFSLQYNGIYLWERIRHHIFRYVNSDNLKKNIGFLKTQSRRVKAINLGIKNLFFKNPYLSGRNDILFFGSSRRERQVGGYWWDIYTDPIHESCEYDYVQIEKPYDISHKKPPKTNNIRYLDSLWLLSILSNKFSYPRINLEGDLKQKISEAKLQIKYKSGKDVPIEEFAKRALRKRKIELPLYKRLLESVNPTMAVIINSDNKENFIEAGKKLEIPIIELQHGVIHKGHLGYSFPGSKTKVQFPDYLLTFGEFWADAIEYPIPKDRVIPVGYPHLEQRKGEYPDEMGNDQIIFISQPNRGELSKFALQVEKSPKIDYNIIYKLHPNEYDNWKERYPWLADGNIDVVDKSEPTLYELFSQSDAQIGVSSTAIYEGMSFNLETYVYDNPESSFLDPLVDEGSASSVNTVNELSTKISQQSRKSDIGYYFRQNATENMCSVLDYLVEEGKSFM